jgi:hypothetical protein
MSTVVKDNSFSTFYLLDLDRTLFDTAKATEIMRGVVALHDTALAAALEQRFEEYERLGESFSMRDFIVENVGEDEMQKIETKYIERARSQDILMPGTKELLEYLRSKQGVGMGILTYGSPLGQAMKIRAAVGLEEIPFLITAETYKGAQIASWRGSDEVYHLPDELGGGTTPSIVFVDDKPFSFKGLPIDCVGYHVISVFDAGIEKLPPNVTTLKNLAGVIKAEKIRTN